MAVDPNPWRRAPANSTTDTPISARSSIPVEPRGPAIGLFVKPLYRNQAQPGNVAPAIDPPMCAWTNTVSKRQKGAKKG